MSRGVLITVAVVFLIVFGLIAFFLARGGSEKIAPDTVLSIWAPFDEGKVYEEIAAPFFTAHPEIKYEFRYINANDAKEYEAIVVDAIASGKGPDVWLIRTDWLPKHEAKLVAAPSTLRWSTNRKVKNDQALKELLGEAVVKQNSRGGTLYGIPLSVDSLALYINQSVISDTRRELANQKDDRHKVLSEDPTTWARVAEWSRLVTQKNRDGITRSGLAFGTIDNTYAPVDAYLALLTQFTGRLYTENESEVALHHTLSDNSVPAVQALDFYTSFSTPGNPNYTWNKALGDPAKALAEERLAMLIGFSSVREQLLRIDKDIKGITIAPLPQQREIALPTDERTDYAVYWTHVVSKTSDVSALSWQLLKTFTTPSVQRKYEDKTLKPTLEQTKKTGRNEIGTSNLSVNKVFAQQVMNSGTVYKPEWQFVDEALQTMIRSVTEGHQTAQVAVDTAAASLKNGRP